MKITFKGKETWIEDDDGKTMQCQKVETLNLPDSILVFKTGMCLNKKTIDEVCEDLKQRTGHNCILLTRDIELVAQISTASTDNDHKPEGGERMKTAVFDGNVWPLDVHDNRVLYECDQRLCPKCKAGCMYTTCKKHAVNFKKKNGIYVEALR